MVFALGDYYYYWGLLLLLGIIIISDYYWGLLLSVIIILDSADTLLCEMTMAHTVLVTASISL